jgi:hypothetical protein
MKLWYKWWSQASDGFGKGLAGAIASGPAKISYRDEGTITLNYGPVFGVRYISMGIRGGGSTAPNPDYPPEFTVVVDLSSSSRVKAWPGLPVSKMEQEVVEVVSNLAKKELGRIGRAKVRASRGKYWSATVSLDPNMSKGLGKDVASATIQTLGSKIGKAVNRVLVAYQQEYEASREKRIDGLEGEVESTQVRRELMWDKADSLMVAADTDPYAEDEAEELRSEAYQMGIQIIRLQEQLSGITGKKYPKPEFRKQGGAGMKPQDRKSLIRLASALPKGSEERRAILSGLKQGSGDFHNEWQAAYRLGMGDLQKRWTGLLTKAGRQFKKDDWKLESGSWLGYYNHGSDGARMDGLLMFEDLRNQARGTRETEGWLEANLGLSYNLKGRGYGKWSLSLEE